MDVGLIGTVPAFVGAAQRLPENTVKITWTTRVHFMMFVLASAAESGSGDYNLHSHFADAFGESRIIFKASLIVSRVNGQNVFEHDAGRYFVTGVAAFAARHHRPVRF